MSKEAAVAALTGLGFTELEAEVYVFLLQESPATGYRVAQGAGRLPANVYKALESLQARGAVIVDEGTSRLCRALPFEELLDLLKRRFDQRQKTAAAALADLRVSKEDDRVYQLRTVEQVFERCRTMLARATQIVLLDIFPAPLQALSSDIETAAARGVQIELKAYQPWDLAGVTITLNPHGERFVAVYPVQWIILLVDGKEMLIAALDAAQKEVRQAIWSGSPMLTYMFHCSLVSEMMLCALLFYIFEQSALTELKNTVDTFFTTPGLPPEDSRIGALFARWIRLYGPSVPGFREMVARFGDPGAAGPSSLSSFSNSHLKGNTH